MIMYRVAVMKYSDTKIELDFTTWADAMEFIKATLRATDEYVSFRLETFEGD